MVEQRLPSLSLKLQICRLSRQVVFNKLEKAPREFGFTLKRVLDMIKTCSQMHHTDTYWNHSSIIWLVRTNGWVLVYELSASRFESCCNHFTGTFLMVEIFSIKACMDQKFYSKYLDWKLSFHGKYLLLSYKNILYHQFTFLLYRRKFQI